MPEDLYFSNRDLTDEQADRIHRFANDIGTCPSRYESIVDRRWIEEFNFCGCGDPDGSRSFLLALLDAYAHRANGGDWDSVKKAIAADPDGAELFIYYTLDALGLTDHGGSVYGSFLTEKGHALRKELQENPATPLVPKS